MSGYDMMNFSPIVCKPELPAFDSAKKNSEHSESMFSGHWRNQMNRLEKNNVRNLVRGIGLAGNMGLSVGVTTFLGVLAGNFLDEKYGRGKGIIFSIVLVLSVVLGLYGAIRALLKALEAPDDKAGSGMQG